MHQLKSIYNSSFKDSPSQPIHTCFPMIPRNEFYLLFSGTHSYIDGTKDWKVMKKRLRFLMPHVPLKVLRGQQDEEDIQDQYYDRFQAPPGTSTEEEAERAADDDSTTSHSSHEDITTDVDEVSEDGIERYLGRHTGAMHNVNQVEIPNDQNENTPQYDTTGSVNLEAADVQAVAQMHPMPSIDVASNNSVDLSNDDRHLSYLMNIDCNTDGC